MATQAQQSRTATTMTQSKPADDAAFTPLVEEMLAKQGERIELVSASYREELERPFNAFRRAMATASAIERLEALLDNKTMQQIMKLQNTPLGFKTDKRDGGYDVATVKRCCIQATLWGVSWIGNEFNIISQSCYVTREGYERKVREIPGLADLELMPGVPNLHNGHTVVRVGARWRLGDKQHELRDAKGEPGFPFPIITHQTSSPDNIIGKARRKALRMIYDISTGNQSGIPDEEDIVADARPATNGTSAPLPNGSLDLRKKTEPAKPETAAPVAETKAPKLETKPAKTETATTNYDGDPDPSSPESKALMAEWAAGKD